MNRLLKIMLSILIIYSTVGSLSSSITGAPSISFSISLTGTYDTMVASTSFNY